jgi:HEAT repeat protein
MERSIPLGLPVPNALKKCGGPSDGEHKPLSLPDLIRFMPVPGPSRVEITMTVLAASGAVRAVEALVTALDIPREAVQVAAAQAIINRTSLHGQLELLSRFDRLPPAVREVIRGAGDVLEPALRQMLMHTDSLSRTRALRIIDETYQFTQIPHLITLLKSAGLNDVARVHDVLGRLLDRVFDAYQSTHPEEFGVPAALTHLDKAIENFDKLAMTENVVLGILLLGEPYHAVVKHALWHGPPACRDVAARLLMESRHPGVVQHLAASLSQPYPHPKVFEVLGQRRDPELIAALLRQITMLPWLDVSTDMLATIPPALHPALVRFVAATRLPGSVKTAVHEWLLRHGTPAGRDAAEEHLPLLEENVVQEVVRQSLQDDDEQVQAWAVHQLRLHAVPEAFALLIERLDSPNAGVQTAAREELAGFNTERVLELTEEFTQEESLVAGRLVQKVDPDVTMKLRRMLSHPIRQKRIKVGRKVIKLGLHSLVPEAFVAMSDDLDPLVRRTAVAALGMIPANDAYIALRHLINDPNPRVREEAETALQHWTATTVHGSVE